MQVNNNNFQKLQNISFINQYFICNILITSPFLNTDFKKLYKTNILFVLNYFSKFLKMFDYFIISLS